MANNERAPDTAAIRRWFDREVSEFSSLNWEELHDESLKRVDALVAEVVALRRERDGLAKWVGETTGLRWEEEGAIERWLGEANAKD